MDERKISLKQVKTANNKDLISELPDCILSTILSFLTTKDAIKTSILSIRWKYIWLARPNNFNFDHLNVFGSTEEEKEFKMDTGNFELVVERRRKYTRVVDHLLQFYQLHDCKKINSFKVSFYLGKESASCLDQWVSSALTLGVEHLSLTFSCDSYLREFYQLHEVLLYAFPCWLLSRPDISTSTLKRLSLEACILKPSPNLMGYFSNLRAVDLYGVFVGEAFVECLFTSCLLLDDLSVIKCYGISNLNVVGPFLRLVSCKVINCYPLEHIQIDAINLTNFEYCGDIRKISFIDAPKLAKVFFYSTTRKGGIALALAKFASLPQLEILIMGINDPTEVRGISSFRNVRQLDFIAEYIASATDLNDLIWVLSILPAFPLLEKLSFLLPGRGFGDQKEIQELGEVPQNHLKEVVMGGFTGAWYELEFVKYVLKTATKLERLVINPFKRIYYGGERWLNWDPNPFWYHSGCEVTRKFLQKEVPAGVHYKIL